MRNVRTDMLYFVVGVLLICGMTVALAVLVVRVMSAHDRGSHAEVEVKVKKVLHQNPQMKIQRGSVTLYPESWTTQGCTCPILNPGQLQPLPMTLLLTMQKLINEPILEWTTCQLCAEWRIYRDGFEWVPTP